MELRFSIENQSLKRLDKNVIVNKTREYVTLIFSFLTEDWENVNKNVILRDEDEKNYQFNIGTNCQGTLTVPEKVLYGGFFKVSVFGIVEDTRITTDVRTVVLSPSGYTTNISPIGEDEYSPDVFDELNDMVSTKADIVHYHDMDEVNDLETALESKAEKVHLHISNDVTDFGETVDLDLNNLLDNFTEQIRRM